LGYRKTKKKKAQSRPLKKERTLHEPQIERLIKLQNKNKLKYKKSQI